MIEPGRYESVVDRQIREAQGRGAFDDLPGAGKPLLASAPAPETPTRRWWRRRHG